MRIAILQRDPLQRQSIEKTLVQAGHTCVTYDDGLNMSRVLARSTVDLLVLDWHGVRLSGVDVLKSVRAVGGDRLPAVRAFAAGADDYVSLPLRPAEFRERVAALLRRAYPDRHSVASFDAGPYHFDGRRQLVMLRGEPVNLSGTQYRLASLFFANIGRVLSRDHIFAMVWGREFREFTRTIDSHVSRLRLLLEIDQDSGFRLQPVYKSGYRLLNLRHADAQIEKAAA
jgi:DNA-binding response OmpR family regulator